MDRCEDLRVYFNDSVQKLHARPYQSDQDQNNINYDTPLLSAMSVTIAHMPLDCLTKDAHTCTRRIDKLSSYKIVYAALVCLQ